MKIKIIDGQIVLEEINKTHIFFHTKKHGFKSQFSGEISKSKFRCSLKSIKLAESQKVFLFDPILNKSAKSLSTYPQLFILA